MMPHWESYLPVRKEVTPGTKEYKTMGNKTHRCRAEQSGLAVVAPHLHEHAACPFPAFCRHARRHRLCAGCQSFSDTSPAPSGGLRARGRRRRCPQRHRSGGRVRQTAAAQCAGQLPARSPQRPAALPEQSARHRRPGTLPTLHSHGPSVSSGTPKSNRGPDLRLPAPGGDIVLTHKPDPRPNWNPVFFEFAPADQYQVEGTYVSQTSIPCGTVSVSSPSWPFRPKRL